jgi:hypothetical protein
MQVYPNAERARLPRFWQFTRNVDLADSAVGSIYANFIVCRDETSA